MKKVYLGIPTYDGRVGEGIVNAITNAVVSPSLGRLHIESGSWTTRNFNSLLAAALNEREKGITHFLLLHEDIIIQTTIEKPWIDKMLELMDRSKCDVLSVVISLKLNAGLTSTALDEPLKDYDPRWRVRRLTLNEIYGKYEPTFTTDTLLVNTGCLLIDLNAPWVENIWFEFEDRIIKTDSGKYVSVGFPEDWNFSRRARAAGAKIYATREIKVTHMGRVGFRNDGPWGTSVEDQ